MVLFQCHCPRKSSLNAKPNHVSLIEPNEDDETPLSLSFSLQFNTPSLLLILIPFTYKSSFSSHLIDSFISLSLFAVFCFLHFLFGCFCRSERAWLLQRLLSWFHWACSSSSPVSSLISFRFLFFSLDSSKFFFFFY